MKMGEKTHTFLDTEVQGTNNAENTSISSLVDCHNVV